MSDTNLSAQMYYKYRGVPVKKSQSEADYVNQYPEVEANSIDDGMLIFSSICLLGTKTHTLETSVSQKLCTCTTLFCIIQHF